MFVLDTDILSLLLRAHARVTERVAQATEEVTIMLISRIEIVQGRFAFADHAQRPSCPGATPAQFDQTQRLQQAEIILQSSLGGSRLQPVEDVLDHPPLADGRKGERGQPNGHWSPKIASLTWRWGKRGKKRQARYGIGARVARG